MPELCQNLKNDHDLTNPSKLQIFNQRLLLKIGVPKSKKENVSKLCMEETQLAYCIYIVVVAENLRADPKNLQAQHLFLIKRKTSIAKGQHLEKPKVENKKIIYAHSTLVTMPSDNDQMDGQCQNDMNKCRFHHPRIQYEVGRHNGTIVEAVPHPFYINSTNSW
uniref:Uncharacterized protein n=1 Tax=Romanomermis culicivorax TaxID=13658 RepID=A0A915IZ12_ROMCU